MLSKESDRSIISQGLHWRQYAGYLFMKLNLTVGERGVEEDGRVELAAAKLQ